jgi:hypothetical protein
LVVKLESRDQHASQCEFNPGLEINCPNGCGVKLKKTEINKHMCKVLLKNLRQQHKSELRLLRIKNESEIIEIKLKHQNELTAMKLKHKREIIRMFESKHNYIFSENTFCATFDYEASEIDEVSLITGDFIFNCEPLEEGWMKGTVQRTGKTGMLPSNFVTPILSPGRHIKEDTDTDKDSDWEDIDD